jgi:hypothetical protein
MMLSPKENLLRVIYHDNPEWVPNGMENVVSMWSPAIERPWEEGYDSFAVYWDHNPEAEGGTYMAHGRHTITDVRQWREQITLPDVDALDWDALPEIDSLEPVQLDEIDRDEYLVLGISIAGLFERSYMLLGLESALTAYLTDPEPMEEMIAAIADYKIALITRFHEVADLDIVMYGDDWGTQRNLFLPPDAWRRIIKPHTKRIYDRIRELGCLVCQHSCGKIDMIFEDLVEIGLDIYNPCQPCNDLAWLKQAYGDQVTFYGGLDSQFVLNRPGATADEVRAEVRRRIEELAAGGGYIAAPSQTVPYDPEILAAMNDEIATYGRAYYRGQA